MNNDLQLLSTLLGRPISANDLPSLVNTAEKPGTTTTTTTQKPAVIQEVELLQNLLQANKLNEDATVEVPEDAYGKTNDAILATLLKQQGIGPAHNNVPVQQLISGNLYPTTTTSRPRTGTLRPARPLLDGLTWLWRTWQDTAPGAQNAVMTNSGRTKTRASAYTAPSGAQSPNAPVNFDEGLDTDTAAVSDLFHLFISECQFPFPLKHMFPSYSNRWHQTVKQLAHLDLAYLEDNCSRLPWVLQER